MTVKLRMARGGSKKRPFYRIVAADGRAPRDGRYIEKLGYHNPLLPKGHADRYSMDMERVRYWLGTGAQPSERMQKLLVEAGVMEKRVIREQTKQHLPKAKTLARMQEAEEAKKAAAEAAAAEAEAPAEEVKAEAPAEEAPAEEAPAEEAKAEESAPEEAKAEEAPAEAPAEEAPAEEAKAEESAPEEAKAEEAKTEESAPEEAKAEEGVGEEKAD